MSANRPRDVVFHLQIALAAISGGAVTVDGLLGPQTHSAYHALPTQLQTIVKELYVDPSPFLSDRLRRKQSASEKYVYVDKTEVERAVKRASSRLDVPESFLQLMLKQENWVAAEKIKTSMTGSFRGIAQFNASTWDTIATRYPELRLSSFETGTTRSEESVLAASALYLENRAVFERAFPNKRYTDAIAYLFHQQGASGALEFLRTGDLVYPEQSSSSISLFEKEQRKFT